MKNILNKLISKHHSEYTPNDILKGKKIIQDLLEIKPHEVKNIYELKQSTKIAFIFLKGRKYYFSIKDLKKILRLNEFGIKESEKLSDTKLKSHFYGHAGYIAQQLFKKTLKIEYANKALKYSNKSLEKYKNEITYQIQINNNLINLGIFLLKQTLNNKNLTKKWIKLTLKKIKEQLEIKDKYPNITHNIESKKLNNLSNFLNNRLGNLKNKSK